MFNNFNIKQKKNKAEINVIKFKSSNSYRYFSSGPFNVE